MHIKDYLDGGKGDWPPDGAPIVESPWLDFSTLQVRGNSIWIADPDVFCLEAGATRIFELSEDWQAS